MTWALSFETNEERFLELVNCLTLLYNYKYFLRSQGDNISISPIKFNLNLNPSFLPKNHKVRNGEGKKNNLI